MSRLFYHTMQDNAGNLLFDVSGTMRLAGSGTVATIYGDEALTVILPNPMTNHPSFGSFKCFLGAGDYDFYMAKAGYTFETLTGVQGHGTMAQQDASAVTITGGGADLANLSALLVRCGDHAVAGYPLDVAGLARISGQTILGLAGPPTAANVMNSVYFDKSANFGMGFRQLVNDTGSGQPIQFYNNAGTSVGLISTTATTTAYATTSDARLKHDVATLTGELDLLGLLRPVSFRWNADNTRGYGFIASEVQQALPDANVITGLPDAMDEEGRILPQMIDYSKLVPFLTGACKTLAAQVEALTARIGVLEDALGV